MLGEPFNEQRLFSNGARERPFVAVGHSDGQAWVGAIFVAFAFLPSPIEVELDEKTPFVAKKRKFYVEVREKSVPGLEVADYEVGVLDFEVPTPDPGITAFKI
jgi:hypothetical protein